MLFRSRIIRTLALVLLAAAVPAELWALGRREVKMQVRGPDCGIEVVYRRTYASGQTETYSVYAEELAVDGGTAYQSISVYPDRVRRITMRASDLTPIFMSETWNDGSSLIRRSYQGNFVHALRRNLPDPYDEVIEVPAGVHDPESFAFLLKGYPFSEQDSIAPINVLVADPNPVFTRPRVFAVNIIPRGEERVTVPAGTFDCYVLEMSLAGVLGYIVPENRFWLLKADPHLIIKAQGAGEVIELTGGPYNCDYVKHCTARPMLPGRK
ncbi:MAG TPA: DUF3108 domain-containing protein [bacterium]|nr:DUF3108 domain-containing protein [bacterium]